MAFNVEDLATAHAPEAVRASANAIKIKNKKNKKTKRKEKKGEKTEKGRKCENQVE